MGALVVAGGGWLCRGVKETGLSEWWVSASVVSPVCLLDDDRIGGVVGYVSNGA